MKRRMLTGERQLSGDAVHDLFELADGFAIDVVRALNLEAIVDVSVRKNYGGKHLATGGFSDCYSTNLGQIDPSSVTVAGDQFDELHGRLPHESGVL